MSRADRVEAGLAGAADPAVLRPRIAYLVSQYPAPSHTFIRREIAALRRAGVDIATFSIRPGEALSEEDRAELSRTFYVLAPPWTGLLVDVAAALARHPLRFLRTLAATLRHRTPGNAALLRAASSFVEGTRLARELERRGMQHVHVHFANAGANIGLAAARYLGLGFSLTVHGLSDLEGPYAALLPEKVAAAQFVACATRYGRAQLMRVTPPEAWPRLHVVRCGVELPAGRAPAARRAGPAAPLEVVCVARLAPEKAHVGLVEAYAIAVRHGVDARLTLVGGGPEEARIRAAIAAHRVADRVVLRGPLPERAALEAIAASDVLVLSSLAEGLPVVLMEALALGIPVIAPAINGIPELVADGVTGLLFTVGDWRELADRLGTLAADPRLRARLGAAGRARVLADFDAASAAAPLAPLFRHPAPRAAPDDVALRFAR